MMALKGSLQIRKNIRSGRLGASTSERARLTTTLILNFSLRSPLRAIHFFSAISLKPARPTSARSRFANQTRFYQLT